MAALASFAADAAFVAIVFIVLGSARAPARVLVTTILLTGAVIAVIQFGSSYFVTSASNNPVLAPFAAVIALLLFVDLTARSILIAAAWIGVTAGGGTPPEPTHELPSPARRSGKSVTTRRPRVASRRASVGPLGPGTIVWFVALSVMTTFVCSLARQR